MTSEQASTAGGRRRRSGATCATLAALVYLGFALAIMAPALAAPRRLLPYLAALESPPAGWRIAQLDHRDERMVVSVVARNAAILTSRPWQLFGDGQCYPMPHGYTLGEHMFGLGLLAAAPWALTHDPILSYNVTLVLTLWLPALTMYALSLHFTRSPYAAFVAGMLFELLPKRLGDPSHPYIHGDLWTPLVLLFLHRVFTRGGFWNAVGLSLFTSLVLCESLYPLVGLAILLCLYGPYVVVRHRDRLARVLPLLVPCAAWIVLVAWLVFAPYLETRASWALLAGRKTPLLPSAAYLPGRMLFPGFVLLTLVVVGLLDRLRGPRRVAGEDPRLAFFAGGVLIIASTIGVWSLPSLGIQFESPLALARNLLPGLDAVRGLPAVGVSAGLPLAFVAGYGALALTERRRPSSAILIVSAVVAAVLACGFYTPLAYRAFGVYSLATATFDARPAEDDLVLARDAGDGALLDIPFSWQGAKRLSMSDDLLLASYHPRPTAACYNSFVSPVQEQIGALAQALPDAAAADALAALGFTTVLVEQTQMLDSERERFFAAVDAQQTENLRLSLLGETEHRTAYRLRSPVAVHPDFALLASGAPATGATVALPASGGRVPFVFRNASDATFRHPDPLLPSDLLVRWSNDRGAVIHEQRLRALLPMALAAHASSTIMIDLPGPGAAGTYMVALARAAEPSAILAQGSVRVSEQGSARPPAMDDEEDAPSSD